MNKIIETSLLLFFLLVLSSTVSVQGKIADSKPIIKDNVRYESHRHTVWATDIGTEKVLWKTGIPMDYYKGDIDPRLERDVQWNIIAYLNLKGKILLVTNSKGEIFKLDSVTGELIKKLKNKTSNTIICLHSIRARNTPTSFQLKKTSIARAE